MRLRLSVLLLAGYGLLLLYAGWMPLNFRYDPARGSRSLSAALRSWPVGPATTLKASDVAVNVAVFVPLGLLLAVAARRRSVWRRLGGALGASLALGAIIEAGQLLLPQRVAALSDLTCDGLGGLAGALLALAALSQPAAAAYRSLCHRGKTWLYGPVEANRWVLRRQLRLALPAVLGVAAGLAALALILQALWARGGASGPPLWHLYWVASLAVGERLAEQIWLTGLLSFMLAFYLSVRTRLALTARVVLSSAGSTVCVVAVALARMAIWAQPVHVSLLAEQALAAAGGAVVFAAMWGVLDRRGGQPAVRYAGPERRRP